MSISYTKDNFNRKYTSFSEEDDGVFILECCVENFDGTKFCIIKEKFNKNNSDDSYAIELFSKYFSVDALENKRIEILSHNLQIASKRKIEEYLKEASKKSTRRTSSIEINSRGEKIRKTIIESNYNPDSKLFENIEVIEEKL